MCKFQLMVKLFLQYYLHHCLIEKHFFVYISEHLQHLKIKVNFNLFERTCILIHLSTTLQNLLKIRK